MIRLLHLSDPHFGAADAEVAAAFLECAAELEPDLTLLSGDLTMRARSSELAAARAFVDALPTPAVLIPGNHDIPGLNQPFDRFFRPFHKYQEIFGSDLEPEFFMQGIHVVSLNSTRAFGFHADWSEGKLLDSQLHRAGANFAAGSPALRLLMLHHPLMAPEGHGRSVVEPLPDLLGLISRSHVDLVLCGHFHQSHLATIGADESWHGIVSQASTVCSTRLQGEPQGFHEIRVTVNQMQIIRHRYLGRRFVADGIYLFRRGVTGWRAVDTEPGYGGGGG